MTTLRSLTAVLVLLLGSAGAAVAQDRHVVSPSALAETVAGHVATQDTQRAAIQATLARPEVQELAKKIGVDIQSLQAGVATMSGSELADVAARANQVDQSLVGGASTITISTTTIIIVLLLVILILVID